MRRLGPVGVLTTEFFKAPHFGGFRDEMDHPLLLDMAIHQLDSARFLLDSDPVSVYCEEYNPAWSWYRGDAGCTAIFEMSSGARYVFTGTLVQPRPGDVVERILAGQRGVRLRPVERRRAAGGRERPTSVASEPASAITDCSGDGIAGSLREFVRALRTGSVPMGEVHDNIFSLAMVEAAIESNAGGARVLLRDHLSARSTRDRRRTTRRRRAGVEDLARSRRLRRR